MVSYVDLDALEPLSQAEVRLVDALRTYAACDFADGVDVAPRDLDEWGDERTIRAAVLEALIIGTGNERWNVKPGSRIRLRGAVVTGEVSCSEEAVLGSVMIESSRFDGQVIMQRTSFVQALEFKGCEFRQNFWLNESTFGARVSFTECDFHADPWFQQSTFLGPARFSDTTFRGGASFSDTDFRSDALFDSCEFVGAAWFGEARFNGYTTFSGCVMKDRAFFYKTSWRDGPYFSGAAFAGDATFSSMSVKGETWFTDAIFGGEAGFYSSEFNGECRFSNTVFGKDTSFESAKFNSEIYLSNVVAYSDVSFQSAVIAGSFTCYDSCFRGSLSFGRSEIAAAAVADSFAKKWDFFEAKISATNIGTMIGSEIVFLRTVFQNHCTLYAAASKIWCAAMRVEKGIFLALCSPDVDLSDAEFSERSIVSTYLKGRLESTTLDRDRVVGDGAIRDRGRAVIDAGNAFLLSLRSEIDSLPVQCVIRSLARANIGELEITTAILDECRFNSASGLDNLRIGSSCTFLTMPRFWRGRRFVRRRVLQEEVDWREAHFGRRRIRSEPSLQTSEHVAGLYRDLRKGLEDSKNEPGAADFYYGEMEMRRLSGRQRPTGLTPLQRPRAVERTLLYCYWLVSGYGMRASRAAITLSASIFVAAFLFTHGSLAVMSTPAPTPMSVNVASGIIAYSAPVAARPPDFAEALEFAARRSVSITQIGAPRNITPRGLGIVLEILLRLIGPGLLALFFLALRARTKR